MKCLTRCYFIMSICLSTIVFYSCGENAVDEIEGAVTSSFEINGMTCPHKCVQELEALLHKSKNPHIYKTTIDYKTHSCQILHDKKITANDIKNIIESSNKFTVKRMIK